MANTAQKLYECQQVSMAMQSEINRLKQELDSVRRICSIAIANRDKIFEENEDLRTENRALRKTVKALEKRR